LPTLATPGRFRWGRWNRTSGPLRYPDERGSTVVETVLVIPVIMLILLALVQMALWAHAAQVAQLAASEGDRSARSFGGSALAGVSSADSILHGSGSDLASSNAAVTVMPGDLARVTVTGAAVTVLPGVSFPVSAVVVGPIQEFRGSE
jgi:Flp pilus assembly protein TadG